MNKNLSLLFAALIGAVGGGVLVMVATRAIPKMFASMMAEMMGKMKSQIGECGCSSKEMCQQIMASFAEAPKEQASSS